MKQQLICMAVALGVLAGCGDSGGTSDPKCQTGACGAQRFCAHTPDGGVCWKDTTAPVISASSLTCSTTPCRRDSVLTVTATVADESYGNAMGEVKVALDLDKEHPLTLQRVSPTGNDYRLDVKLADLPFPYFAHDVAGTISAKDEATNGATQELAAVGVTRERWTKVIRGASAVSLSSPAILVDGRIALGGSDGKLYLVSADGQSTTSTQLTDAVSGPPVVGSDAIWLATRDGRLHKRALADAQDATPAGCSTTNAGVRLLGPPVVLTDGRALAVSADTEVLITKTTNACNSDALPSPATAAPAVDALGAVVIATAEGLTKHTISNISRLEDAWPGVTLPFVGSVVEPLSVDAENAAWSIAMNGAVFRTTSAGVPGQVSSAPAPSSGGVIVLSDGSAVVADYDPVLMRLSKSGASVWSVNPTLPGRPSTPVALTGNESTLLVPSSDGSVSLLSQSTGELVWSVKRSVQPLQPAGVRADAGGRTSTAYVAGDDGTLYAIIVDGTLDTTAPWPKAYHDPQNTSNAATPF